MKILRNLLRKHPLISGLVILGILDSFSKPSYLGFMETNINNKIKSPFRQRYSITSKFGNRIHNGKQEFHNGIDLAVPAGTKFYAPFSGRVVWDTNTLGGQELFLIGENYRLGFAHLHERFAGNNSSVSQGTLLASTGGGHGDGDSTGPHSHFTVTDLKTNKKIDPETIIDFNTYA